MKNILPKLSFLLLGIASFCQPKKDARPESETNNISSPYRLDFNAIADKVIERASLEDKERVLLIARPGGFDSLVLLLKEKIENSRGRYLGTISVTDEMPEEWQTEFTRASSAMSGELLTEHLMDVDLAIMLPGTDTTHAPYAAMQDVLWHGSGRTIHFHWAGAYHMNGTVLERSQMMDELYQTALLRTDYEKLSDHQKQFESQARKNIIRVTSPLGTDIRFSIGDRPVTKQDGDASKSRSGIARNLIDREIELPAGAVRVAPLEETVEGKIAFPEMTWDGYTIKGLVLEFSEGKVVDIIATEGLDHVKAELDNAGPGASSFRELAVGLNPWLAVPQVGPQWIPYYGYGAGVIRLSLGDNSELGGKVTGGYVRWNFFTDATLQIGDEVWIKDGHMTHTFE